MSTDVHISAGAYALNALPSAEAQQFWSHLDDCELCREEVAGFTVTAAALGRSVAVSPSASLKQRVLAAVAVTRQLPPLVPRAENVRTLRRRPWPQLLAAAAAVTLVAVGGVVAGVVLDDDPDPVAEVLAADDLHRRTAPVNGGGSMTLISSVDLGRAVVLTEDLPPLPEGEVYQLWLLDEQDKAHATDVLIGSESPGAVLVPTEDPDYRVAITREPVGGSRQPSMEPLAVLEQT